MAMFENISTVVRATLMISEDVRELVMASAEQIPSTCRVTGFSFSNGVMKCLLGTHPEPPPVFRGGRSRSCAREGLVAVRAEPVVHQAGDGVSGNRCAGQCVNLVSRGCRAGCNTAFADPEAELPLRIVNPPPFPLLQPVSMRIWSPRPGVSFCS